MDKSFVRDAFSGLYTPGNSGKDIIKPKGVFVFEYLDKTGKLLWKDAINNTIMDLGANLMLNQCFGAAQNAAYFMGLISSVGYTGIPVVGDTMSSHASSNHVWVEAGNGSNYPNWSTPASNARATLAWSAAAARAKALSSAAAFTFATNGGTVKGAFIVTGSGAVATNNDTNGTLFCAGVFSGGDQVVSVGGTLSVSYSVTLS
jgi:hypothetical protein